MKSFASLFSALVAPANRRDNRLVIRLVIGIILLVAAYTFIFHVLMAREGKSYSVLTGVYWTFTVMTTLGFGDITFESDAGKAFSLLVMLTGAFLILVILPFVFIQFVFRPWLNAREANRVPRRVSESMRDHVILTQFDAVVETLVRRLDDLKIPYVIVVEGHAEAVELSNRGYKAMLGDLDDPATYAAARADTAALVARSGVAVGDAQASAASILETDTDLSNVVVSVATLLQCLHVAETHGAVPPLGEEWWDRVLPERFRPGCEPGLAQMKGQIQ